MPGPLEQATATLDGHPDAVCATPRVEFVGPDGRRRFAVDSGALRGGLCDNLDRYLRDPLDNSRFYGVYRREVLRRVFPSSVLYGLDWARRCTLLYGKQAKLADVLLLREASDPVKYVRMVDAIAPAARPAFFRLLPQCAPRLSWERAHPGGCPLTILATRV